MSCDFVTCLVTTLDVTVENWETIVVSVVWCAWPAVLDVETSAEFDLDIAEYDCDE